MAEELTPKQARFLNVYLDPKSDTFGNALQSGLKAGFSREYSETLTTKGLKWLSEGVGRRTKLLDKAERNLLEILEMESAELEIMKLKNNTSQFVAKTLGKKDYSDRTEHTGEGGGDININISKDISDKHETT